MAQQQVNVNVASVGFNGLNTEDSPITQDYSFASVADNAVIDGYGRVGARKAFDAETTTFPSLTSIVGATSHVLEVDKVGGSTINGVVSIIMAVRNLGYDAGGNLVGTGYHMLERDGGTLTEITLPAISDDSTLPSCQIVTTDDRYYVFSATNETMVWNGTAMTLISAETGYYGIQNVPAGSQVAPTFQRGMAAYGRIWAAGHEGDNQTLYYSDLLIGASAYTVDGLDSLSTAGKLNVLENWPDGRDSIVGVAAHNNRVVIFGRQNILIFNAGYGDPAEAASGFALEDTISNVGCVSRDCIINIGTDLLFMDDSGVRSLGRTIQERSSPMGNLTNKVRNDISGLIGQTVDKAGISMEYDAANNFVLALFPEQQLAYCLDMKSYQTQGLAKVTRWTDCNFNNMLYIEEASLPLLLLGGKIDTGIMQYSGYTSATGSPYTFKYYSNQMNFGEPAKTKFPKQIDYTIISSQFAGVAFAKWGYDSTNVYKSKQLTLQANTPAFWGEGEYGVATYGASDSILKRYKVNINGSGEALDIGLEVTIDGNGVSLQEINVQTLIGRIN
jgi:hypothetical protein